jgi:hypothetical protein
MFIGGVAALLFLCALVSACMGQWGPAGACLLIAFIFLAATSAEDTARRNRQYRRNRYRRF